MSEECTNRNSENVKVFIRLRPLKSFEECSNISLVNDEFIKVSKTDNERDTKVFQFNKIFNQEATQLEIYKMVASPLVDQALNGYNGTIFAYGQSGTGKTFTILGGTKDTQLRGIVPNIFSHILTQISIANSCSSYLVTVTFLEIYNEEVRDLLDDSKRKKLEVRESPELGVYVKNLSGVTVESTEQVFEIISKGSKNRVLGSTNLNNRSSRSHAIFSIRIEAKHEDGTTTFGKLNLVDLAGSERVSKSLATGDRLKEAGKINLSLSVLGNVISALVDGNTTHIPYRNSKLTRLLQDSLGGSCLTSMIATISPCKEHFEETYYTLMYAERAKEIKNNVKKNEESKSVLKNFEDKIMALQKQLNDLNQKQISRTSKRHLKKCPSDRDVQLKATENEKNTLLEKISTLQKKILVGGENLFKKAQLQLELLDHSAKQLKLFDSTQQLLQETLENKQQEKVGFERKSLTIQEEDKLLDFQIEQAKKKIAKKEKFLFKKENQYQNEISNLLYANKCLAKDMGLRNYIINKFIPEQDIEKIKGNIFWDEDLHEYRLKSIAHCGNNLKKISLDVGKGPVVGVGIKSRYRKYPNE